MLSLVLCIPGAASAPMGAVAPVWAPSFQMPEVLMPGIRESNTVHVLLRALVPEVPNYIPSFDNRHPSSLTGFPRVEDVEQRFEGYIANPLSFVERATKNIDVVTASLPGVVVSRGLRSFMASTATAYQKALEKSGLLQDPKQFLFDFPVDDQHAVLQATWAYLTSSRRFLQGVRRVRGVGRMSSDEVRRFQVFFDAMAILTSDAGVLAPLDFDGEARVRLETAVVVLEELADFAAKGFISRSALFGICAAVGALVAVIVVRLFQ
ncbi:MAG: hypothetical protein KVP17_001913 [Porospora cf. gigantea B]|uniref:uncharacterized protein n=2 Tax=Porospora cf. gigantea B TaxID=2853592 RepID=UPI003571B962|nr:MAG: hypothetical protein KVP17_001913 [Porospora cf. gigantea B]